MLRLRAAMPPFDDTRVAGQAARLLALVEATGAWRPQKVVGELDLELFQDALDSLVPFGVARSAAFETEAYAGKPAEDFATWIGRLREVVASSPMPEVELPKLEELFRTDTVAELLGVGASTLRRYLAHERQVPDDVARHAHVVARIVGDLAGFYNERGIRQWFTRPRSQLGDKTPAEVLRRAWETDEADAGPVLELAAELTG